MRLVRPLVAVAIAMGLVACATIIDLAEPTGSAGAARDGSVAPVDGTPAGDATASEASTNDAGLASGSFDPAFGDAGGVGFSAPVVAIVPLDLSRIGYVTGQTTTSVLIQALDEHGQTATAGIAPIAPQHSARVLTPAALERDRAGNVYIGGYSDDQTGAASSPYNTWVQRITPIEGNTALYNGPRSQQPSLLGFAPTPAAKVALFAHDEGTDVTAGNGPTTSGRDEVGSAVQGSVTYAAQYIATLLQTGTDLHLYVYVYDKNNPTQGQLDRPSELSPNMFTLATDGAIVTSAAIGRDVDTTIFSVVGTADHLYFSKLKIGAQVPDPLVPPSTAFPLESPTIRSVALNGDLLYVAGCTGDTPWIGRFSVVDFEPDATWGDHGALTLARYAHACTSSIRLDDGGRPYALLTGTTSTATSILRLIP